MYTTKLAKIAIKYRFHTLEPSSISQYTKRNVFILYSTIYFYYTLGVKIVVILFDRFNLPENIYEIVFATEQQVIVGKMLIDYMKANGRSIGKTEMSLFATKLHEGTLVEVNQATEESPIPSKKKITISYNKRQFYDRILTPMKAMGMIDYDLYKKVYTISDKLNKSLITIGLLWVREIRE